MIYVQKKKGSSNMVIGLNTISGQLEKITHSSEQSNYDGKKSILKISGLFFIQLNLLTCQFSYQFTKCIKN